MSKPKVKLYVTSHCPFCVRAKTFLQNKGIPFELIDLTHQPEQLKQLKETTHWKTVPQIFIGPTFIGGYTDMLQLDTAGKFDELIKASND